jgi:CPA2 family monovalent cation:H+ antiporter-2
MIALLSGIAMTGSLQVVQVGTTLGKLGIFLVAALVIGLLAVPRLLGYVARFKSNEMLLISVLGLCFGFSLLASKLGYSVALGAFLIGAVIAEAREIHRVEALIEPVRDMFSAIFFVAIGLLIDPKMLATYWFPIVVITLAVVLGKVVTCSFGAFVGGNDTRTSLRVGMGLAQIGEFSFIIASLGLTLKVTSDFLYPIAVAVSAFTTLLTPYLIKSADNLVSWFDRAAPRPLVGYLELYTQWVGQFSRPRSSSLARRFAKRWIWQILLNVLLIAAIFVSAAFVIQSRPTWLSRLPLGEDSLKAVFWLGAVIMALPLLIASFRKLQALGMLIAELKVTRVAAGENTQAIRAIVSQAIAIIGMFGLSLFVLILSSTLLPPLKVLIVFLLVIALVTWLMWRSFIKIYSKAQAALHEVLSQPPVPPHQDSPTALPAILQHATLRTVPLNPTSPAARKLIRELQLRTQTGASIVGIERNGTNIINPGPDEELLPGDQLLLLGNPSQLQAAEAALTA